MTIHNPRCNAAKTVRNARVRAKRIIAVRPDRNGALVGIVTLAIKRFARLFAPAQPNIA